jgi:hypothetical protein
MKRWMSLAEHVVFMDAGPEVSDSEQPDEDHGEVLQGMYVPVFESIVQDRPTAEQAEELRLGIRPRGAAGHGAASHPSGALPRQCIIIIQRWEIMASIHMWSSIDRQRHARNSVG